MIDNPGFPDHHLFGMMQNRKMNPQISIWRLAQSFPQRGRMAWLPEIDWREAMASIGGLAGQEYFVTTYHATRDQHGRTGNGPSEAGRRMSLNVYGLKNCDTCRKA